MTGSFRVVLLVCYRDHTWREEVVFVPASRFVSGVEHALSDAMLEARARDDVVHVHGLSARWTEEVA